MTKSDKKKSVELLTDPVHQSLKRLTVPTVLGMIFLMTFNIVDTFFISLLGTQPLAAVSFTFPVTFTIVSLTIGLGIGTATVVGKALGEKNTALAKSLTTSAIYITAIIVGFLSFLVYMFLDEMFLMLGASEEILPFIHQYMDIWLLGSVLLIGPMIGNAAIRATGDTKTPSIIMGIAGLFNAVLDPILIFGVGPIPEMGIQGAAIATFISWVVGVILGFYVLTVKKDLLHTSFITVKEFLSASKNVLSIGIPAAGANMLTPIATAILTAIVAMFGETAVAAFGVGSRIEMIGCLVIFALSMTLPAFISQNFGALKMNRIKVAYQTCIKFVLVFQIAIYCILALLAPYISHAFTSDEEVSKLIEMFIWIVPLGYGLQGVIILTNSSFNALHKPVVSLVLSFIRLFICYVPCAYVGSVFYGIQGFFIGCVVGNFIMAFISYALFTKEYKKPIFTDEKKVEGTT